MIYLDVDTAVTVPVNVMPLIDDTDFKTREVSVTYDAAGMDLVWNFVTSAGVITQTAVTPTTGGDYDWTHVGDGMYKIELPASGGVSANNDTEGYGYFSGVATGVLPWRGPTVCFRASGTNDLLCDNAYSATRGLSGTALPDAAADGAGGLPISDGGGLDLDAILADTNAVQTDLADGGRVDLLIDAIKVVTDALGATAATRLALSAGQMIPGTVDTVTNGHTPTGTEFQADDITEATSDHYNGRIVVFTSGALVGQATDITDYVAVGGIGQFTVTALTEAPSNDDTFIII